MKLKKLLSRTQYLVDAMNHVITVSPIGELTALLCRKGQGVSIKELGQADIERYSEIVFLKEHQKFAVKFLQEFKDKHLSVPLMRSFSLLIQEYAQDLYDKYLETLANSSDEQKILLFDEYEDAVRAEVQFYNIVRASKIPDNVQRLKNIYMLQ